MPSAQDSHCKAYASVQIMQDLTELLSLAALGEGKENILFCATFWSILFCIKAFFFAIKLPYKDTSKGL